MPENLWNAPHGRLDWQPFSDVPLTIACMVMRYRRDADLEEHPNAQAWFCHVPKTGNSRVCGLIVFSAPNLTPDIVTHEMTHAMRYYCDTIKQRYLQIPMNVQRVEPRLHMQMEEVLCYGIQQTHLLHRELQRTVQRLRREQRRKKTR